jgi:hypothetical protein
LGTISKLEQENAALRAAVEARLAASDSGCCSGGKCHPQKDDSLRQAIDTAFAGLESIGTSMPPNDFVEANKHFELKPAAPQKPAEFRVEQIGQTLTAEQLEEVWAATRARQQEMLDRIKGDQVHETTDEPEQFDRVVFAEESPRDEKPFRLIGITGRAGSGKNTVASMIPGAVVLQLADPLYASLSVMTGIPEVLLRNREFKEREIPWLGKTVRQMLQTLGTEWGREHVCSDIWVKMLERRIETLAHEGVKTIAVADVRFENEAAVIRGFNGGEVWHVRRPSRDASAVEHQSEAGIAFRSEFDAMLVNDGSIESLHLKVQAAFTLEAEFA